MFFENKEITKELFIGMEFSSNDSAYKTQAKYGGKNGFNVRKQKQEWFGCKVINLIVAQNKFSRKLTKNMIRLTLYQSQGGLQSSYVLSFSEQWKIKDHVTQANS